MEKWDPKWNKTSFASYDNYWAGAKKACDDIGMSLPDISKLQSLASKTTAEKEQLGLPTSGYVWSSSEKSHEGAYIVRAGTGIKDATRKDDSRKQVLCVGDQIFKSL